MEVLTLQLSNDALWEQLVKGPESLRQMGAATVVTKDSATAAGKAGIAITFPVQCPDGTTRIAQLTTTYPLLRNLLQVLEARYSADGRVMRAN